MYIIDICLYFNEESLTITSIYLKKQFYYLETKFDLVCISTRILCRNIYLTFLLYLTYQTYISSYLLIIPSL